MATASRSSALISGRRPPRPRRRRPRPIARGSRRRRVRAVAACRDVAGSTIGRQCPAVTRRAIAAQANDDGLAQVDVGHAAGVALREREAFHESFVRHRRFRRRLVAGGRVRASSAADQRCREQPDRDGLGHPWSGHSLISRAPRSVYGASPHVLEVPRLPAPVEGRLLRAIDAEVREPPFAGNRPDPLLLLAGRRARAEGAMTTIGLRQDSVRPLIQPVRTARMARQLLLACGILSSLLYVATDILGGLRYEGYSFTSQAVSELMAIGACGSREPC
jgi:hypothetical protein